MKGTQSTTITLTPFERRVARHVFDVIVNDAAVESIRMDIGSDFPSGTTGENEELMAIHNVIDSFILALDGKL